MSKGDMLLVKVFILALDGLEYDLVKRWKMENLMQKKYGKMVLSTEYYHADEHVPYTPIIWASFITGVPAKEHDIRSIFIYGKILDSFRNLPLIKWIKGKRKIFWRVGLKPRVVDRRDLKAKTFFDEIEPSIALDVPAYNEPTEVNLRLGKIIMTRGLKEYVKEAWEVYKDRKKRVFEYINENWKIFMAYFKIADLLGHIYIAKSPKDLQKVYETLERLASDINEKISEETVFLIISDHGMKPEPDGTGNHSVYAFYSLNFKTRWEPKDITDFYLKILEWAK